MSGVARSGGGLFGRLAAVWGAAGLGESSYPCLTTTRLVLRPPQRSDYIAWTRLRRASHGMLKRWEPSWSADHLSEHSFRRRVRWSAGEIQHGRAYPLLIFERDARVGLNLVGGVTLEHVRHGAAMSASLGYWLGVGAEGRGLMTEALEATVAFALYELDLSRLEAACLSDNARSRRLLERVGFREEGFAAAYLQIDGVWRDHVLYELRRNDRSDPHSAL